MKDYPYVQSDNTPEIDAEANEWGASQEERTTDATFWHARFREMEKENELLREQNKAIIPLLEKVDRYVQAIGIMATIKPTMAMNVNDPVSMALEVAEYVNGLVEKIESLENRGGFEESGV